MGSATAGLVFVIVVVVIAIVCFRYWLFREEGPKLGLGVAHVCHRAFPLTCGQSSGNSSHRVKDWTGHAWVPEQRSCGEDCASASPAPIWLCPGSCHACSTTRPSPPIAPWVEGWLCIQAARGKALWHRLSLLGFGSWQ